MALLPGGGMAFSLQGAGVLLRDGQGRFTHLTQREGLGAENINRLYVSPGGQLFACSYSGLHLLSLRGDAWEVATIDRKAGLPSDQVNDVIAIGQEVWAATNQGLARFSELPTPLPMPAPVLDKWRVNNREIRFAPGMQFSHNDNNLRMRFHALHYRSEGEIPYRYRLLGADTTYTYAKVREISFARLAPGAYVFEVQAQNEAGTWSEPARWAFRVRLAWWQTLWFQIGAGLLLIAGAVFWNYRRLQKSRREARDREKMRELEAAALRAQMNPHFIFNCLGSIQHFIAENDPATATRYLARFARLVRLALHGSVDGRHSLRDEIAMLENYLELEQLRFRGKFAYEIQTDPSLDPDDISLPPLLVQPFVENAILHGMKNKERGGIITIAFTLSDDSLAVEVSDNGPGLAAPGDAPSPDRKSVGMMLTERRLEMLAGKGEGQVFQMETIAGPDGSAKGTRVRVQIPLA